jgi:hypothetical protein
MIGDRVEKSSGYLFSGIVKSRYTVDDGNRYDVQVDSKEAENYILKLNESGTIDEYEFKQLLKYVKNCHGMIHIFNEHQLQLV